MSPIPVNVFTGFLGAGKTTIIQSLLSSLPSNYNVVILKNEFGNIQTDSELLKNFKVTEIVNGCLCCILVGQIKNALLEIQEKYNPDRIVIETSGSAFPAPISIQIRELSPAFQLDSIVTVIDCVNFTGYEDKSYTAKIQAQYTDLILLNKHQLVSEDIFDRCVDSVNDLNTDTPKLKFSQQIGLSSDLIFGVDTKLFEAGSREIEAATLDTRHHFREVDLIQIVMNDPPTSMLDLLCNDRLHSHAISSSNTCKVMARRKITLADLSTFLNSLSSEDVYRVKGFVRVYIGTANLSSVHVLNWAFGRFTLDKMEGDGDASLYVKVVVMGDLKQSIYVDKFRIWFGANSSEIEYIQAELLNA